MSEKNTVEKWEEIQGRVLLNLDELSLKQKISVDDFNTISDERGYINVDHEFRKNWLEYNGYEINRENLINAELPTVKLPA